MSLLGLLEQVCAFFPRQITCSKSIEKRIRGCFSLVHRGSSSFFLAPVLPCGSGQLEPRATDRSIYTHMILLYFPHQINVALGSSCRPLKRRSVVAERKRSRSPSMSSLLSRLRLVTVDVTGTLIAYRGQLGDYYCMAAKSAGMPCPDYGRVHEGFKLAYADMSRRHPCFGHAAAMPAAEWWKTCVRDSFVRAGYDYDDETFERIFRRIYSTFGSAAPYAVFPDAQRFLRWLRKEGLVVGIVSNAEHRYRDVVLPALGLNQGSEWDFGVFSGVVGVEKPDPRIYEAALRQAAGGGVAPGEALHIGDSLRKDYAPARSLGMHALLLDRFRTAEAESWRRSGAPVLPDLVAAQEWLAGGHSHREEADQPVTAR